MRVHAYRNHGAARQPQARLRTASIALVLGLVAAVVLAGPSGTARAATRVDLGTAANFAVLAGSTITNTGATTITGDVGLHPGTAVTGFNTVTHNGQLHVADATASTAKSHLGTAYTDAAGQGPATRVATELGGKVLKGGVYDAASGTFGLTGTLTLDAQNDPTTVWIFQTTSTLITASNSSVRLTNQADACNVYWQVGSSATLGTGTAFVGNILAMQSITLDTSATIRGRALARSGAVTMDTNTITRAVCTTQTSPTPSPSPTTTPSPTTSPSPSPTASPTPSPTPTTSPSPTPAPSPSTTTPPADVAVPADGTTGGSGTPDTPDATTGVPAAPGAPAVPVGAAPPSGGPQVPTVPRGSVPAGDGSMAVDAGDGNATGVRLLALLAGLVLYGTWRRRHA